MPLPSPLLACPPYASLASRTVQVDNRHQEDPVITPEQAIKLCDRNFGIGGDGVSGVGWAAWPAALPAADRVHRLCCSLGRFTE